VHWQGEGQHEGSLRGVTFWSLLSFLFFFWTFYFFFNLSTWFHFFYLFIFTFFFLVYRFGSTVKLPVTLLDLHTNLVSLRTSFLASASRPMASGSWVAPRIVAFSSGTQSLAMLRWCCKATRTPVSRFPLSRHVNSFLILSSRGYSHLCCPRPDRQPICDRQWRHACTNLEVSHSWSRLVWFSLVDPFFLFRYSNYNGR